MDWNVNRLRLESPVTNCIFHGVMVDANPDKPATVFGPANGLAVCRVEAMAEMAAQNVTVMQFASAKAKYWRARLRRRFGV